MNRCARKNEKKNRHRHGHTRSQHDTKIWCVDRFYTQNKWVIYSTHSLTHNVCRVVSFELANNCRGFFDLLD